MKEKLVRIEENITMLLLAALILFVFFAAVLRNIGINIQWSMDMAQLLFAWIVSLGADMALRRHSHMGLDIIIGKLPNKWRKTINLINNVLILMFLSIAVYYGFQLVFQNLQRKFNTLPISYSWATAAVPVGCSFMWVQTLSTIKSLVLSYFHKEEGV